MKRIFLIFILLFGNGMFLYSQFGGSQVTFKFGPDYDWSNSNIYMKWFQSYFDTVSIYPKTAIKYSIEGKFIVKPIMMRDGTLQNIKILKRLSEDIDNSVPFIFKITENEPNPAGADLQSVPHQ